MLYSEDIALCNKEMQASPEGFKRGLTFVLATIQQQLETVPSIMLDLESMGAASRFAFGSKRDGITYIQTQYLRLYQQATAVKHDSSLLMGVFLQVPGLGLVKAGFACQLFANRVGCIDTHNLKLYNIPLSAVKLNYKLKPETIAKKVNNYIALCQGIGGSALLWSAWCDYVAKQRPKNWRDGAEVSGFHVDAVKGVQSIPIDLFDGIDYAPKYERRTDND